MPLKGSISVIYGAMTLGKLNAYLESIVGVYCFSSLLAFYTIVVMNWSIYLSKEKLRFSYWAGRGVR